MNEDGQCFPRGGCPEGYHRVEDDESGRCIPNTVGCPEGMILTPNKKSCEYKENVCQTYPELEECRETPTCDPSYPTECIKSPPPDLNCKDVPSRNFKVIEPDPHGFDRDNDGIGCEFGGNGGGGNGGTTRNTITQTGTIVIQDLTGSITTTPNCAPIARTMSLGPSTMAEEGMRVIATLSPCHLLDGTVMLNLPTNGIHLVVANVVTGQPVNAIAVNKQLVANLGNGQGLYSVDLGERMSGTTPNKNTPATLNDNINTILLWNDAGRVVQFNADNSLALNIISHR
jgi:hypothetical protein